MTSLNRQDADLHREDGTHRSTASSANGSAVARHEERLRRHLDAHETARKLEFLAARNAR